MPANKLTDQEKAARGTLPSPIRRTKPRAPADIEVAIADATELLDSLTFLLKQAQHSVRTDGLQIGVTTRNNKNESVTSSKLNPSVKLILSIPPQIRLVRRELVLLNAELDTATAAVRQKEADAEEWRGLD